jgi:3-hydroxyacyl-CoA dehydrogenase/enoyl-CoA hydratase/3-hydroxybutyryl-CoA epimerase
MAGFNAESLSGGVQAGGIAVVTVDVPKRPHNVLNPQVMRELEDAFDWAAADSAVKLLVICSKKEAGFFAGADVQQFTTVQGPAEATALAGAGQRLFDKVAALRMPVIAVIHGVCLGGGLELALACDYRVAVDLPTTQIGFPELKLGLLPGWGGTQRLPRVVGVERAIGMILQSKQLNATEALRIGLVDAVQKTREEALSFASGALAERARTEGKRPKNGPPMHSWRQRLVESNPLGRWLLFRGAERMVRRRTPDDMPAPLETLLAIRVGLAKGMAEGLKYEREAIGRLATTPACRNLVTLFFMMENARKPPAASENNGIPAIRRVGIVGAGTMGAGIAQLAAVKGFDVVIQEVDEAALTTGVRKVEDLLLKAAGRGLISAEEARRRFAAIGKTTKWEGFADLDLVIEAVVEDVHIKRSVFQELEKRTKPQAILATNTSSLSVRELQQGLSRPDRVGGLHFFNPVHKMPLVEVVQAPATSESVAQALTGWAAAVGKTPVLVKDSPGFVVNRILMPYLNEAVLLAASKTGIEQIDHVMRRFGMPMGPFELMDQVGLDVGAHIGRTMEPHFGRRFPPNPAFERMTQRGWLGQKSGVGFYRYQGKKKQVNQDVMTASIFPHEGGGTGSTNPAEIRDRMVLLMVNEAAACLEEGLAASADVVDLAMILGTGWAPHRGGPLRYADDRGPKEIVSALEDLAKRYAVRFEPCTEIRRRAEKGEPFYNQRLELQTVGK